MAFRMIFTVGKGTRSKLLLRKIMAMFIITVYLTASARGVPEARSHSPTSSSQALKPDSKPSVCGHTETGIMFFCTKAYGRFCVSAAYLLCTRRHASAPLDSSTERTRACTLPFVIKADEWYICFTAAREIGKAESPKRPQGQK